MTIYLDTNVLPRKGPLRSAALDALLRIAQQRRQVVAIPEIVVHESVNARYESVLNEVEKLRKAVSEASSFFDVDPVYLPEPEEVATNWEETLRHTFEVIPDAPDHALEALRREARRVRPASKGKGARDSLIWLTVLRHAKDSKGTHHFVSSNTNDFQGLKDLLHDDLATEARQQGVDLEYSSTTETLLARLADQANYTISRDDALNEEHRGQVFFELFSGPWVDNLLEAHGGSASGANTLIKLKSVKTHRSYQVEETLLASGTTVWTVSLEGFEDQLEVAISVDAWFVFEAGALEKVELRSVRST
ncbi:PIN domain-containing protein [Kineococcus esterisolvens]|uniref:PIN domain-containing protein n=1 Tax=unclassified Kineococcus TaxID=2621656 RepID=UPI003D7D58AE